MKPKHIELATRDAIELLGKGNWVVMTHVNDREITVTYGTIHTNGDFEQAIATRHYSLDRNGNLEYHNEVHP